MRKFIIRYVKRRVPTVIDRDYHIILQHHSSYYVRLDDRHRSIFRLRLFHLLNVLSFTSTHYPTVSREMRVVIGSAIIEITFGLRNYLPLKFVRVEVLPSRYMYPGYGEPFLGHIDYTTGTIYFSWRDVKHGYRRPDDALNVALHEMAHVLEAENRYMYLFDGFFKRVEWNKWARVAFEKMYVIRSGDATFLKSYGGINMKEMFAVCIEAFFEQPQRFAQHLPEIYSAMVDLLRQDPRLEGNPRV